MKYKIVMCVLSYIIEMCVLEDLDNVFMVQIRYEDELF